MLGVESGIGRTNLYRYLKRDAKITKIKAKSGGAAAGAVSGCIAWSQEIVAPKPCAGSHSGWETGCFKTGQFPSLTQSRKLYSSTSHRKCAH